MINRHLHRSIPGALMAGAVVAIAMANGGCSAASTAADAVNNAEQATSGCDEFSGGADAVGKLSIDGDTKAFVTASANLVAIAKSAETDVYGACKNICGDLKIADTWTAMEKNGDVDDAVTEACHQASLKISGTLTADAGCNLVISGGHCTVDTTVQAMCESSCSANAMCTPPDVTTSCTPGEITGGCSGTCMANATCEGSVDAQAECTGKCMADCTGMCDSTPCQGTFCKGQCQGKCTGDCKLMADATASCGANVNCKGGCSVAYTAPKCETKTTPPSCKVSTTCQASCTSTVESKSVCTKPSVSLECSAMVSADVQAVITTVKANLPSIILLVQSQGNLILDAATQVGDTADAVSKDVTSLGGKAIACAAAAVKADVSTAASLKVSVNASASVSGSCGGPGMAM
jgi:hypothetical protein